jgi:Fic family protein
VSNLFVPKGTTYLNEEEKLRLETRNGVIQAEFIFSESISWPRGQKIAPKLLCKLQELAVNQIYRCAGFFRDDAVALDGARHQPPHHSAVEPLVHEMCAYVNDHWHEKSAVHLAAYAMWRVNWIHPFFGGNGRSARAFSYLILCLRIGFTLPAGEKTIPELIIENRNPYYDALKQSDAAWEIGALDICAMEKLVSDLLAIQLVGVFNKATGVRESELS